MAMRLVIDRRTLVLTGTLGVGALALPGVAAAFEVEHSTSIYSGIVRMLDLALSGSDLHAAAGLFLVAPNAREQDVRAQLRRPAFSRIADLDFAYLPYGELERNRDAIARFGTGLKAIKAISSPLP